MWPFYGRTLSHNAEHSHFWTRFHMKRFPRLFQLWLPFLFCVGQQAAWKNGRHQSCPELSHLSLSPRVSMAELPTKLERGMRGEWRRCVFRKIYSHQWTEKQPKRCFPLYIHTYTYIHTCIHTSVAFWDVIGSFLNCIQLDWPRLKRAPKTQESGQVF